MTREEKLEDVAEFMEELRCELEDMAKEALADMRAHGWTDQMAAVGP